MIDSTCYRKSPLDEIEQFERERTAQREAQHIVLQWLRAIETAQRTSEELALLGYGIEGMDIALAGAKLESNPPIEYLRRLVDWRDSDRSNTDKANQASG